MTINHVNPEQRMNRVIAWLLLGVVCSSLMLVSLYNTTSSLRQQVRKENDIVERLELESATLKSRRYELLDTIRLSQVADTNGLVRESDPRFLSIDTSEAHPSKAQALQY